MTSLIERIDALTHDQRQAICEASSAGGPFRPAAAGILVLPLKSDGGALNRSIVEMGLAGYSSFGVALTKSGKKVREILRADIAALRARGVE